jgi:hypothetical protein
MKRTSQSSRPIGPGEYLPDRSEGIQRVEDLPQPKVVKQSRNYPHRVCPRCGQSAYRNRTFTRRLHDIGDLMSGRPRDIVLTYSQHYCSACHTYFNADMSDVAPPGGHYTHRVMALGIRTVVEDGLAYRSASWRLWRDYRVFVPFATLQNWVEAGGKKGSGAMGKHLSPLGA